MNQEANILRIRQKVYNHHLAVGREIDEVMQAKNNSEHIAFELFPGKHDFPTVSVLRQERVEYHLRKLLPYLIYYKDVYKNEDNPAVAEMKAYLGEIFDNYLEVIPDKDYELLDSKTGATWRNASLEERAESMEDIIAYYGFDEFDEFIKDLGYFPFMRHYKLTLKNFKANDFPQDMLNDLKAVWDKVQGVEL